jgi:hypothetical protein
MAWDSTQRRIAPSSAAKRAFEDDDDDEGGDGSNERSGHSFQCSGHKVYLNGICFHMPAFDGETSSGGEHLAAAYAMSRSITSPASAWTVVNVLRKTMVTRAMLDVRDNSIAAEHVCGIAHNVCTSGMSDELVTVVISSGMLLGLCAAAEQVYGGAAPLLSVLLALTDGARPPALLDTVVANMMPVVKFVADNLPMEDVEKFCVVAERVATSSKGSECVGVVTFSVNDRLCGVTAEASTALFRAWDACKDYSFAEHVVDDPLRYGQVCSGTMLLDAARLVAAMSPLPLPENVVLAALHIITHGDVGERWPEVRCCLRPSADVLDLAFENGIGSVQGAIVLALVASDTRDVGAETQANILSAVVRAAREGFPPPPEVVRMMCSWTGESVQHFSVVCDVLANCPELCGMLHNMSSSDARMLLELEVA